MTDNPTLRVTLINLQDVLKVVSDFCDQTQPFVGERFKKQLRNTIRAIPRSRAPVAAPQGDVGISWTALLSVLERLRSKNRNPDNVWYHGWNAAIQCLINDVNARSSSPASSPVPPEQGDVRISFAPSVTDAATGGKCPRCEGSIPTGCRCPTPCPACGHAGKVVKGLCRAIANEFGPQHERQVCECDCFAAFAATPSEPGTLYWTKDADGYPILDAIPPTAAPPAIPSHSVREAAEAPPAVTEAGKQERQMCACGHPHIDHRFYSDHDECLACKPVEGAENDGLCCEFRAAPPSTSEAIRGAAREWMNTWHGAFATNKEREDALVAILSRWFGKGEIDLPKVICLCGSARFADEFMRQYQRLTEAGHIVLLPCMPMRVGMEQSEPDLKERLDALHKRKIDLADEVFVLNVGGYVGPSTGSEIAYAQTRGTSVIYMESDAAPASPSPAEPPGFRNTKEAMEYARRNNIPAVIPVSAAGGDEDERFRECREGRAQTIANRERYEDRERCHAQKDGDCEAPTCPQLRDGEPAKTGRHCPIDTWPNED